MKLFKLFLWTCAGLAAVAPLRAQEPQANAPEGFKGAFGFEVAKGIPQRPIEPAGAASAAASAPPKLVLNCSYSKKDSWDSLELGSLVSGSHDALFESSDGGWKAAAFEPVDGRRLGLTATTSDSGASLKALLTWHGGAARAAFAPKGGKLDGYRFTVVLKTPEKACIVVGCGVNAEPASLKGKSCD